MKKTNKKIVRHKIDEFYHMKFSTWKIKPNKLPANWLAKENTNEKIYFKEDRYWENYV